MDGRRGRSKARSVDGRRNVELKRTRGPRANQTPRAALRETKKSTNLSRLALSTPRSYSFLFRGRFSEAHAAEGLMC